MSRDPAGFPAWCETEFGWDEGDREEVPYPALVTYEDAALLGLEPKFARHPDLGWMVVADVPGSPHRLPVWHEASEHDLLAAARLWAEHDLPAAARLWAEHDLPAAARHWAD